LQTFGQVHSFTLNLRHDIEALARRQPDPCTWLRDRIEAELRKGFGCPVQFLVWFEENPWLVEKVRRGNKIWEIGERLRIIDGKYRPLFHAHGELVTNDIEKARACLRRAGGEYAKGRQYQALTKPDPDAGWISYMAKTYWRMKPGIGEMFAHSRFFPPITFTGDVFSASRPVTQKARELFEADRVSLLRACSKSK
jgi:hypothetical protein